MNIPESLTSQYRAAMQMLRSAVEACPESLWTDGATKNRFWHVAYHAVFYADLYLTGSPEAFTPWEKGRADYHYLGRKPSPHHEEPKIGEPYTKAEILEYLDRVAASVAARVRQLPLDEPSGFPWLPFRRLELHLYNVRHVQHHAGQLIDRIREKCGVGVGWVGMVRDE